MSNNLITKFLQFKKARLTTYALTLSTEIKLRPFLIEYLNRYMDNYIELIYHNRYETLEKTTPPTKEDIKKEQLAITLELLEELSVREILETNEGYKRKKDLIKEAENLAQQIIIFDQEEKEENYKDKINQTTTSISARREWIKEYNKTKKILDQILSPKPNFTLKQIPYEEDNLYEITILSLVKQLNNYKKSLVERVEKEEKTMVEKTKLSVIIINQIILKQLIEKEKVKDYIIPVPENMYKKPQEINTIFELLNDKILKDHVFLGISYNQVINNKTLKEKKKEGYHFICYQDFTYITDIPTKVDNIDSSNLFDYLMITNYKEKDYQTLTKQEPSNMKKVLFSKEG